MKVNSIIILVIIVLAAANVYQYRNPQVIEVPGVQTPIDSTAWVQRSDYADHGVLLDSIEADNEMLAQRVRKTRDEIANLTNINGRLNLQVDSLETVNRLPISSPSGKNATALDVTNTVNVTSSTYENKSRQFERNEAKRNIDENREPELPDTSYNFLSVFGDDLFRVDSEVRFDAEYLENNLNLTQLRDIEISVVNTMNADRSRLLTYVTSKDFEELEYQTFTELKPRKRWPWFLIGVGVGVAGVAILN